VSEQQRRHFRTVDCFGRLLRRLAAIREEGSSDFIQLLEPALGSALREVGPDGSLESPSLRGRSLLLRHDLARIPEGIVHLAD
jgi:hypothetical protein